MSGPVADWLDSLPAAGLAATICGGLVAVTLLGVFLVHPPMRRLLHAKSPANDLVVYAAGSFGVIYAVLLGLLTVATFQTTKDVEDNIGREASNLSTLYRTADGYPEPLRSDLKSELRDYTRYVLEKDWPAHRKRLVPFGGEHRLQVIRQTLFSFEPATRNQDALHNEMLRYLDAMTAAREQRLGTVTAAIPGVLWYVVLAGALLTIAFSWMLHMERRAQVLFGGITACFLGMVIFLIYAMDHPLQGAVSVGPDAFQSVYDYVMKWDEPA